MGEPDPAGPGVADRLDGDADDADDEDDADVDRELVFAGVRDVCVRPAPTGDPDPDEVVVETSVSAISPGTELLVYRGDVPEGMAADATLDALDGDLSYPTTYGYAAVGEVVAAGADARDRLGERVFAFHPHRSRFRIPARDAVPVPDGVADAAAAMLPTVETATNFLLDGRPRIGERVVVFGAGVVGLCTTRLLADCPLDELVVVEPIDSRRELARAFGADRAVPPERAGGLFADRDPAGADLVYELSGQPAALDDAIDAVGYDGRIVVGSWYGDKRSSLDLGGEFHRDRIAIESSQVSTIAPDLRGRWTTDRRLGVAIDRLGRIDVDALVTDRVPFGEAPDAYRRLDENPGSTLQALLTYP